jgi:cysteine-S-conjugate beta-lyase
MTRIYNFDEIIEREGTSSIKYDFRKQLFGREDVQPLWVADMDFATPDFVRDAIIERVKHPIYGYFLRSEGFNSSVLGWMKRRFDWEIREEWISSCLGVVPAINMCILSMTEPGDEIIIQTPVYHPFSYAVKNHKRKLIENRLILKDKRYFIDFEDLEKKAATASMLILCHPHNPVGRVWIEDELNKLIDICHRHNVLIISDEIHSDLILFHHKHIPLQKLSKADDCKIISLLSPSKTFNLAGLSTSILVCPDQVLKKKYDRTVEKLNIGMGNIFGAIGLEAAYLNGDEWLSQLISYLENNVNYLQNFILENLPELSLIPTEATYLAWIDFRNLGLNSKEQRSFLVNTAGLGLNEGTMFGTGGEGFHRLNFAIPHSKLKEALQKLKMAYLTIH